jgi:hypothetical protein
MYARSCIGTAQALSPRQRREVGGVFVIRKVLSTEKNPIVENGPGHGCGHHLFGTASTAAAIAVISRRGGAGTGQVGSRWSRGHESQKSRRRHLHSGRASFRGGALQDLSQAPPDRFPRKSRALKPWRSPPWTFSKTRLTWRKLVKNFSKRVGPISSTSLFSATASRLWTIASKP